MAEPVDALVSRRLVQPDRLWLPLAGLQHDPGRAEIASALLEVGEDDPREAATAPVGPDVHPLDLHRPDPRHIGDLGAPQPTGRDRLDAVVRDDETTGRRRELARVDR